MLFDISMIFNISNIYNGEKNVFFFFSFLLFFSLLSLSLSLSLFLSRSICKSVQSTSSRGELPSRLSVHASHVHTRCQPRCRTSRAGAWRFINRCASPGKATTTTAAINPFRAKFFFFRHRVHIWRTHLLRVKVASSDDAGVVVRNMRDIGCLRVEYRSACGTQPRIEYGSVWEL